MTKTGETFILNAYGKPFTVASFGNRMREWCNEARLPQCSTHGLRKAAASWLAELGCSEFEHMAITGHKNSKEVAHYVKAASQKKLARAVMAKMSGDLDAAKVSHF